VTRLSGPAAHFSSGGGATRRFVLNATCGAGLTGSGSTRSAARSAWRTQRRSVSAVQPILGAVQSRGGSPEMKTSPRNQRRFLFRGSTFSKVGFSEKAGAIRLPHNNHSCNDMEQCVTPRVSIPFRGDGQHGLIRLSRRPQNSLFTTNNNQIKCLSGNVQPLACLLLSDPPTKDCRAVSARPSRPKGNGPPQVGKIGGPLVRSHHQMRRPPWKLTNSGNFRSKNFIASLAGCSALALTK